MLIARSSLECHLYIELRPCECGEARSPTKHRLECRDDALIAVYDAVCPACGRRQRFEFGLDDEIPPVGKFGGTKPSQIIDAGQFLVVADAAASLVPADASVFDDAQRQRARALLLRAVAAIEEVLKFIPPSLEHVPEESLFTAGGKVLYTAEPGRFGKARLEAVLGVYRDGVSTLS